MVLSPKETLTLVRASLLTREETEILVRRVFDLRDQRRKINNELREIYAQVQILEYGDADEKPRWGPCTRCGHEWTGQRVDSIPRACARCGSTGWRTEPKKAGARRPSDPPSARWGKNRRTGRETDPSQKVGGPQSRREMPQWMRDRLARLTEEQRNERTKRERERGLNIIADQSSHETSQHGGERAGEMASTRKNTEDATVETTGRGASKESRPPQLEDRRGFESPDVSSPSRLSPPPRLADVAPALVPEAAMRFADPGIGSQQSKELARQAEYMNEERRGPVERSVGGFIRRVIDELPPAIDKVNEICIEIARDEVLLEIVEFASVESDGRVRGDHEETTLETQYEEAHRKSANAREEDDGN
jgi:predicted Zn-ribbon and HTH transcriptional regulator